MLLSFWLLLYIIVEQLYHIPIMCTQDVTDQLLPVVLPAIFGILQDQDDDVRAVAATALLPVTDALVQLIPEQVGGEKHTPQLCGT